MPVPIDPTSPIPLYHQIAEAIRERIQAGELEPGDALEPLRTAAESWGVNLHTVRHAYAALAREGLVERTRGPRGTRVLEAPGQRGRRRGLGAFLARTLRDARERFDLGPPELAAALEELARSRVSRRPGAAAPQRPRVHVVECSLWQCAFHVRQIAERWDVDARPWPLDRPEPRGGVLLSTYFHYNDIRRQWPRRLGSARFLTIHPDPALRGSLAGAKGSVQICERDPMTADAVASDVLALLGKDGLRPRPLVQGDPAEALRSRRGPPVLFSPRMWAELDEKDRAHPRAVEIRYVLDEAELDAAGRELGWKRAAGAAA